MPKPKNTRSRVISEKLFTGRTRGRFADNSWEPSPVDLYGEYWVKGKQTTVSEGHLWPPRKGEGIGDRGGPFWTTKQEILSKHRMFSIIDPQQPGGGWQFRYDGNILPIHPINASFPPTIESSDSSLDEWGATAVARSEPTNSAADAATFLAELTRDGLPSLIGHTLWSGITKRGLKSTANEYLNAAFGWLPMVHDIQKFSESIRHANKVLAQYERDSGRIVRRHRSAPTKVDTETSLISTNVTCATFVGGGIDPGPHGDVFRERESTRDLSFAGAFTYYLPSDYDSRRNLSELADKADKLFGLELTPEVIWNATPWSWAVDWFSNTSDVFHNISAFGDHGLVMPYGYVTERTSVTDTYVHSAPAFRPGQIVAPLKLSTRSIKRRQANPFGFGLTWDGLSLFQKSILAALGISRHG